MPQTPKFGKTPLELLEPNPDYEPPFFGKYAVWIFGPLLGVGASMSVNLGQQRPVLRASTFSNANQKKRKIIAPEFDVIQINK